MDFENDIKNCLAVLKNGGLILYPTDTIWGIGCDATNETAVTKVYALKKRNDEKSLVILVAEKSELHQYTDNIDETVFDYLKEASKPTTVIYPSAKNLAANCINNDGSIAIRMVQDDFCKELIRQFGKPIVSTSANISGMPAPKNFKEISEQIKNGADYIVQHRQLENTMSAPSSVIKLNEDGSVTIIRH